MNVKKATKKGSHKLSAGLLERPANPAIKPFNHTITVNNKRYKYSITPINKQWIFFECPAGGIAQRFLAEDVMALLIDLPELILAEFRYKEETKNQNETIRFRVSAEDKQKITENAIKAGYPSVSDFIRSLVLIT